MKLKQTKPNAKFVPKQRAPAPITMTAQPLILTPIGFTQNQLLRKFEAMRQPLLGPN